jgi:hypothetical protein
MSVGANCCRREARFPFGLAHSGSRILDHAGGLGNKNASGSNNEKEIVVEMDIKWQRISTWGGVINFAMAIVGLYIAGFLPPPSPAASAEQIAAIYRANGHSIEIGAIIFLLAIAPALPFIAVISVQMRRIEGNRRIFTYSQLVAGTASIVPLVLVPLAWAVAAFRPEQNAGTIQAFNDFGFITMIMATPMVSMQVLAIGLAILSDTSTRPVFPRWFAYMSFLVAILLLGGLLCVLDRTGPFAWDGRVASLFAYSFLPWTILMAALLLRAIKEQEAEG